jgi:hypothetical protein
MRAFTAALDAFVGPPTYTELRTRQQLGYIVFGGAGNEEDRHFAYFIVQSGDYPADVLAARTDAFIATLPAQLKLLPPQAWQTIKDGVRAKLEEKDKSIAERAARLFGLAYDRQGQWARDAETLAALQALTLERAQALLDAALAPAGRRSLGFLGFARDHRRRRRWRRASTTRANGRAAGATSEDGAPARPRWAQRRQGPWPTSGAEVRGRGPSLRTARRAGRRGALELPHALLQHVQARLLPGLRGRQPPQRCRQPLGRQWRSGTVLQRACQRCRLGLQARQAVVEVDLVARQRDWLA